MAKMTIGEEAAKAASEKESNINEIVAKAVALEVAKATRESNKVILDLQAQTKAANPQPENCVLDVLNVKSNCMIRFKFEKILQDKYGMPVLHASTNTLMRALDKIDANGDNVFYLIEKDSRFPRARVATKEILDRAKDNIDKVKAARKKADEEAVAFAKKIQAQKDRR